MVTYRWMDPEELYRLAELDRFGRIRVGYRMDGDQLLEMEVEWDTSNWLQHGENEHTVSHQIAFCQSHLDAGGRVLGAFEHDKLVGIGLLRPDLRPSMAQLAYLHVSHAHRRRGIASRLCSELEAEARRMGNGHMYVSATPSGSAVGFYTRQGFEPVQDPIPELWEAEPEDIHMSKVIDSDTLSPGS